MRRTPPPTALALTAALALAGCDRADMIAQPKSATWDRNPFFANNSSMRDPVAGTQPRDPPHQPQPQPAVMTAELLARGRERYDIFCTPCHGASGDGQGMIVQRGFSKPPDLADPN